MGKNDLIRKNHVKKSTPFGPVIGQNAKKPGLQHGVFHFQALILFIARYFLL
jgi:hypothetical protein